MCAGLATPRIMEMYRGQGGRQSSESDGLSASYPRAGYRMTVFRLGLPKTMIVRWVSVVFDRSSKKRPYPVA
jgi:hypothetical protein